MEKQNTCRYIRLQFVSITIIEYCHEFIFKRSLQMNLQIDDDKRRCIAIHTSHYVSWQIDINCGKMSRSYPCIVS